MRLLGESRQHTLFALDAEKPLSPAEVECLVEQVTDYGNDRRWARKPWICLELFSPFARNRAHVAGSYAGETWETFWDMVFPEELTEDHLLLLLELAAWLPFEKALADNWDGGSWRLTLTRKTLKRLRIPWPEILALLPALEQGRIRIFGPYQNAAPEPLELRPVEGSQVQDDRLTVDLNPLALQALLGLDGHWLVYEWDTFKMAPRQMPGLLTLCTGLSEHMSRLFDGDGERDIYTPEKIPRSALLSLLGADEETAVDLDSLMQALGQGRQWRVRAGNVFVEWEDASKEDRLFWTRPNTFLPCRAKEPYWLVLHGDVLASSW